MSLKFGSGFEDNAPIEVYSSKTNSWKRVAEIKEEIRFNNAYATFWEGYMHWVVTCLGTREVNEVVVLRYNLLSEQEEEGYYQLVSLRLPYATPRGGLFRVNLVILGSKLLGFYDMEGNTWIIMEHDKNGYLLVVGHAWRLPLMEQCRPVIWSNRVMKVWVVGALVNGQEKLMYYEHDMRKGSPICLPGMPSKFVHNVCLAKLSFLSP